MQDRLRCLSAVISGVEILAISRLGHGGAHFKLLEDAHLVCVRSRLLLT